jgi:predicted enzyme related to lactoylglutathione lyase
MSARKTTKSARKHNSRGPSSIVWFEVPADRPERAKTFYSKLFGWKIKKFPGMGDYWHIDTGGPDATPDGGMYPRKTPQQAITNYVAVPSVDAASAKVTKLGGKICMAKTPVPGMGFFAICQDTEDNTFAIWERSGGAK